MKLIAGAVISLAAVTAFPALAATVTVSVSGIDSDRGVVGCALFAAPAGFPAATAKAKVQARPAKRGGVSCSFAGLDPGRYAVAVSHDRNGNGRLDTNFLGIPIEEWGVSNNARPRMRGPRFEEAAFTLGADQTLRLRVIVR